MFIGEKVLNNDQTCCISFTPSNETKDFIIGVNNNCGFKDITLKLCSTTYNKDFVRVDSAFWYGSNISEKELEALKGQQYYIDNVYFYTEGTETFQTGGALFCNGLLKSAENFRDMTDDFGFLPSHVIVRNKDDNNHVINLYQQLLSYRQHFKNVEIKYFSVGICVELNQVGNSSSDNVWCNSLHFSDIDMWVRNNGFVLKTSGLTNSAQGRFIISNILRLCITICHLQVIKNFLKIFF